MTLPTFAPAATDPLSRCLLSWSARDRSLTCRSGQVLAFSRASIGALTGSNGRVGFAGQYQPRFTMAEGLTAGVFDEMGLLLENAATNLWLRSAEFEHATWVKTALVSPPVPTNVVTGPDGLLSAEKLPETSATAEHKVAQAVAITAGNYVAVSVWARAAERDRLFLHAFNGSDHLQARFDLTAKTATDTSTGAGPLFKAAWLEPYADGWYRCCLVGLVNAGATAITGEIQLCATTVASYAGTTDAGLHVWGAQFEQGNTLGAKPSSYIATAGTTATRAVDALTGSFLWPFGATLTIYTRFIRPRWSGITFDVDAALLSLSSARPRAGLYVSQSTGTLTGYLTDNGVPTNVTVAAAVPATRVGEACLELTGLTTGGKARLDVGSGFGAYSSVLPGGFTAWGGTTVQLGDLIYATGHGFGSELTDVRIQLGARTLAQMKAEW